MRTELLIKKDAEKKSGRRKLIAFKAEPDVAEYFEELDRRGLKTPEAAHKVVRFTRDAEAETGDAVHEKIEQQANKEGVSVGRMYARLAALELKRRR